MRGQQNHAAIAGELLRSIRKTTGQTQGEVAKEAGVKVSRLAHAEQAAEMPPANVLRRIARALGATGEETIELLTQAALSKSRVVVSIEGLSERQVRAIVEKVERSRRKNGSFGACAKCSAGPFDGCAPGCPDGLQFGTIGKKWVVSDGR